MDKMAHVETDKTSKDNSYIDKQKKLSDWYYIKTKSKTEMGLCSSTSLTLRQRNKNVDVKNAAADGDGADPTEPRGIKLFEPMVTHKAQSLPRLPINAGQKVNKKQKQWDNFGAIPKYANICTDDSDEDSSLKDVNMIIDVSGKEEAERSKLRSQCNLNSSLTRDGNKQWSNSITKNRSSPPYYCPPAYSTLHNRLLAEQQGQGDRSHPTTSSIQQPEIIVPGKMNIKLLKQQYEQLQQQQQHHNNRSIEFKDRERIVSPKHKQLRYRENVGTKGKPRENFNDFNGNVPSSSYLHQQQPPQNEHYHQHNEAEINCFTNGDNVTLYSSSIKAKKAIEQDTPSNTLQKQENPLFQPSISSSQSPEKVVAIKTEHTMRRSYNKCQGPRSQEQQETLPNASHCHFVPTPIPSTPRPSLRPSKIIQTNNTDCSSLKRLDVVAVQIRPTEKKHESYDDVPLNTNEENMDKNIPVESGFQDDELTDNERSLSGDNLEYVAPESLIVTTKSPLPARLKLTESQQVQIKLQQNPVTRQLFGVLQSETFNPKHAICRSDGELSGSYASLECPSPPGPPACLPEAQRDPQARLSNFLRIFYQELSFKAPIIPPWVMPPIAIGTLCPARLEPDLRLSANSHGFSDSLTVDQILVSIQTKEGNFLEAPRRCLIECPTWTSRSNICLRILHAWAKDPPWPIKGTPVAVTLFIPLQELKRSFSLYVEKELLPKGRANPFATGSGCFNAAWTSLEALGPKLLIILDGYSTHKCGNGTVTSNGTTKRLKPAGVIGGSTSFSRHHYPSDVNDLLEGNLFPEARVIITTNSSCCMELMPIVQRHIIYDGLTWGRSASILEGGQWGGHSRMLDVIQANANLRNVVKTPLGCLAIAAIYDASNGNLPTEELYVIEAIISCIVPEATTTNIAELGRLALFCLKMKRNCVTMAEIKMYCSAPETVISCLENNVLCGKTAKKKAEHIFNPICPGVMEYLSAHYITSLASRPGLLAAEITGMAVGDELQPELLKVLKFTMVLLGERAHILLSRLTPLWLTPQIIFSLALAGGQSESNLAALCDILGISKHPPISPLETRPLWVQVRSMPTDLMGWGMALKSHSCTLKNLEIIYQLEKQNIAESRKAIDMFLASVTFNESVSTLRLSSLIEIDVKDSEINYLSSCISKLILKPRLENFELVLTLIEEDPPVLKLQSVVTALCRIIPQQPKLSSLLLDLGLNTSQLVQLCSAIEKCPHITRLSLPHLRCERGAIAALSSLLNTKAISFLSLPYCWGTRDDPPSSSGVSMGSGSGSSTGTSCLIKQGSLQGVPLPHLYAPGVFSSLPRGVYVPQSSLGRSATLPRQPLEHTVEKRSCDSVVSKIWYPTPTCDGGPHNSGTMHGLFLALRFKLHGLDLSKAQLTLEDSMCLGETVRLSNTLHTLKFEGASRISELLPIILGACESSCLQMLSLCSQRLNLDDSLVAMCARALTSCSTLRLLSLDGWCFRIEHAQTYSILRALLCLTSIRELSLANCRLQASLIKKDYKTMEVFESRSLVVLKLAGAQVILTDLSVLRGPQLLPYIGGFSCLRELDLSAPTRSGIEGNHTSALFVDDKCLMQFFQNLHSYFGLLNTLKICNWVIQLDDIAKTLKSLAKALRNSLISHLKMDGVSVLDRPKKQRSDAALMHCFIASLPQLRWLGISLSNKKDDQISAIGNAVFDLKGNEIEIKLSESTIDQAKLVAQAISLDGKFDIKVSTFGTSSGILIHAEKTGNKSLQRKTKEAGQYF